MKLLAVSIAFLLLVASFSLALAAPRIHDGPCCTSHTQKSIPRRVVKSYYYTSGNCYLPSVVFIFNNGQSKCANPEAQWVKDLIKALDGN